MEAVEQMINPCHAGMNPKLYNLPGKPTITTNTGYAHNL